MDNDQITSLAREYAEEIYPHEEGEDLGQMEFLRTSAAKHIEASIKMLSRRFCLVEKSRIDALDIAGRAKEYGMVTLSDENVAYLFPEIGKEVEG